MMNYLTRLFLIVFVSTIWIGCGGDDEDPTITTPPPVVNTEIQDFIWQGLNEIYLWQANVPDLADNRFSTTEAYKTFLASEKEPEDFFEKLLYKTNDTDRFSWIVDDYVELENSFAGVAKTNGVEFGLSGISNSNDVFGFVRYILPDTDASGKEIKRGDLFTQVNGIQLTRNNYSDLLFGSASDTYTLTLAKIENNVITETGAMVELTKSEYTENPVHTVKILEVDGRKIGYLLYNSFTYNFADQLNEAFLQFKNEGVTDLVLDLRYNPGGRTRTAISLAGMITGQFNGELFYRERWNQKYQEYFNQEKPDYLINNFSDQLGNGNPINSLNLNKVHILTSRNSASSSELVINGLKPYINVKLIGEVTYGKFVASTTLYDSPNFGKVGANPNHKYAMQPTILESVNKLGENNNNKGFAPDIALSEDIRNMGVLGELSDPLLEAAVNDITGKAQKLETLKRDPRFEEIGSSLESKKFNNIMLIDLKELPVSFSNKVREIQN